MMMNGQRMLVQVTVKQPMKPGQRWWIGAPRKIPEEVPGHGRGVVFTPGAYGHRPEWIITTFSAEMAMELAWDTIAKEISMRKADQIRWGRMVREIADSAPGVKITS